MAGAMPFTTVKPIFNFGKAPNTAGAASFAPTKTSTEGIF